MLGHLKWLRLLGHTNLRCWTWLKLEGKDRVKNKWWGKAVVCLQIVSVQGNGENSNNQRIGCACWGTPITSERERERERERLRKNGITWRGVR